MREAASRLAIFTTIILSVLSGSRCALAQSHPPLQFEGGPVLRSFEIHPLYYGNWTTTEMDALDGYLGKLADYMSGINAPAGKWPMLWQYTGPAKVSALKRHLMNPKDAKPGALTTSQIDDIIKTAQGSNKLPPFGSDKLLLVLPYHGYIVNGCAGCGYHQSESTTAFWAAVPADAGPSQQLVVAHEVFEAATDPAVNNQHGWIATPWGASSPEAVDGCNSPISKFPFINMSFGQIPGAADNTQGGTCSTTGYIPQQNFDTFAIDIQTGDDNADANLELWVDMPGEGTLCLKPSNNTSLPTGGGTIWIACANSSSAPTWNNGEVDKRTLALKTNLALWQINTATLTLMGLQSSCSLSCSNWDLQAITVTFTDSKGKAPPKVALKLGDLGTSNWTSSNCVARLKAAPNATAVDFSLDGFSNTHKYADGKSVGWVTTCEDNGDGGSPPPH